MEVIKMRDPGKPTVTVHVLHGTSEEVAQNRKNVKMAFESALTRLNRDEVQININWGDTQTK
jgi:hypothetical protein